MPFRPRKPMIRFGVIMVSCALVGLAWRGEAEAGWREPPTRAQAASFARGVDSVKVWSLALPDTHAVRGRHGLDVLEAAPTRAAAVMPAAWGRELARALFANGREDEFCSCRLSRGANDTDSAVIALASFYVGNDVMWVPISLRDDCAEVHFVQGYAANLPIRTERDGIWRMLRDALKADAFYADSAPPRAFVPDTARLGRGAVTTPGAGSYVHVDVLPSATRRVPPEYPAAARERGTSGTVHVQALVGKDGAVKDAWVRWSIPGLDEAAVAAVAQWRFEPARAGGEPIAVWVLVPVKFTLH